VVVSGGVGRALAKKETRQRTQNGPKEIEKKDVNSKRMFNGKKGLQVCAGEHQPHHTIIAFETRPIANTESKTGSQQGQ